MHMQEPEQWQPSGQEWQAGQEYGEYHAENPGSYEQQKVYPQEERSLRGTALGILAIILSSIGFFLAVAGIVATAIVLKYANGQQEVLAGGVIGLLSAIGVLLVCVAGFVIAVVALARPHLIRGWGTSRGRSS
jgi:hypothetical protein